MSYKTCPDWPDLMELAPVLQFKHMTVHEAQLPFDIVSRLPADRTLEELEICCDVEHHVFNPAHTDDCVVIALEGSHWYDVKEWSTTGPGTGSSGAGAHAA